MQFLDTSQVYEALNRLKERLPELGEEIEACQEGLEKALDTAAACLGKHINMSVGPSDFTCLLEGGLCAGFRATSPDQEIPAEIHDLDPGGWETADE